MHSQTIAFMAARAGSLTPHIFKIVVDSELGHAHCRILLLQQKLLVVTFCEANKAAMISR